MWGHSARREREREAWGCVVGSCLKDNRLCEKVSPSSAHLLERASPKDSFRGSE